MASPISPVPQLYKSVTHWGRICQCGPVAPLWHWDLSHTHTKILPSASDLTVAGLSKFIFFQVLTFINFHIRHYPIFVQMCIQRTKVPNLRLTLLLSIYSTGLQQQFPESSSGFPFGRAGCAVNWKFQCKVKRGILLYFLRLERYLASTLCLQSWDGLVRHAGTGVNKDLEQIEPLS